MNNPTLIKNLIAEAAIAKRRIVKFGADADHALQGAAVTDLLIGVSTEIDAALGERVDVVLDGIAEVEFGGNVTRGNKLTSDADGKAVVAAPAAGVNNQIIGIAMVDGVLGDIGSVHLKQSVMQGA